MKPLLLTPDGFRYTALGDGHKVPRPFCWRWLLPKLCRRSQARWQAAAILGVVLAAVGTGMMADGWHSGIAAGLMLVALPSTRYNLGTPVLVDAASMGLAVMAAACWVEGLWPLGIVLILVSGTVKETGPAFGALYAWAPWLLVGLVPVLVRALFARPGPDVVANPYRSKPDVVALCADSLAHPLRTGWRVHRPQWFDPTMMILPWGAALAAFGNLDLQLVVLLAVAYAQLLVATDTVRLYQWAAPLMCVAAVGVVPVAWLPLLVVLTIWNPFAGNGV